VTNKTKFKTLAFSGGDNNSVNLRYYYAIVLVGRITGF